MKTLSKIDELVQQVRKEEKFSLFYILQAVNFKVYGYRYADSYKKEELRALVVAELTANNYKKCAELATYKKYA